MGRGECWAVGAHHQPGHVVVRRKVRRHGGGHALAQVARGLRQAQHAVAQAQGAGRWALGAGMFL